MDTRKILAINIIGGLITYFIIKNLIEKKAA
jgi:hypothetical protein